jgi:hypothetical protein
LVYTINILFGIFLNAPQGPPQLLLYRSIQPRTDLYPQAATDSPMSNAIYITTQERKRMLLTITPSNHPFEIIFRLPELSLFRLNPVFLPPKPPFLRRLVP